MLEDSKLQQNSINRRDWLKTASVLAVGGYAASTSATAGAEEYTSDIVVQDSIQDAVDEADPGDVVEIPSGVYEESVTVDKAITLDAQEDAALEGDDLSAEAGITITADGVTIDGLEIRRFEEFGIDVQAGDITLVDVFVRLNGNIGIHATDELLATVDVDDSEVTDNDTTGLYVDGESDVTVDITNSIFSDSGSGDGISIEGAGEITLSNATIENNDSSGLALVDSGDATLTVEDSAFQENSDNGLYTEADSVTVQGTDLVNNGSRGIDVRDAHTVTLDGTSVLNNDANNVYIDHDGVIDGTYTLLDVVAESNEDDSSVAILGEGSDIEITVDGCTSSTGAEHGFRIEGDTVTVEDSAAVENDDTGLRVDGSSDATVTVRDSEFESNTDDSFGANGRGVTLDAETVIIERTTVTNNDSQGIDISGAQSITIEDDVESLNNGDRNIRINHNGILGGNYTLSDVLSENSSDIGVSISGDGSDIEVTLDGCTSSDNDEYGFWVEGDTITVEDSTAAENEDTGLWVDGSSDATVTVRDSEFESNTDDAFGADGRGVALDAETVTVDETRTDNNVGHGIYVEANDITIENSGSNNNGGSNIALDGDDVTDRTAVVQDVDVDGGGSHGIWTSEAAGEDDIEIADTSVTDAGSDGLALDANEITVTNASTEGNVSNGLSADIENATINESRFADNGGAGIDFTALSEAAQIEQSSFVDNEGAAVRNEENAGIVDAPNNWWGTADGPADDDVVGDVLVDPWLDSPPHDETQPDPIDEYRNEDGEVDIDGLRDAIADWRDGELDVTLLRDVINAWRAN